MKIIHFANLVLQSTCVITTMLGSSANRLEIHYESIKGANFYFFYHLTTFDYGIANNSMKVRKYTDLVILSFGLITTVQPY